MRILKVSIFLIVVVTAVNGLSSGQPTSGAGAGSQQTRRPVKIPADSCSLPECACRVVSASGESLCEGGTEGETGEGIHFCKCGKFGYSSAQEGGAGGEFTVQYGSQPAPPAAEPLTATVTAAPVGQAGRQRPVSPIPPASQLFYRSFTATQLGQSNQPAAVSQMGRGGSATMPNTANVVHEIFRRGLGPIVLGVRGQMNADGTEKSYVVLNNQEDVFNLVNPTARGRGTDPATQGRQMSRQQSMARERLQRNLVALKVNMIICENGITVNDPGMRFGDLSLAQDFNLSRFPLFNSCEECNAICHEGIGVCFMTVDLGCRCYLSEKDLMRSTDPDQSESIESTMPRRLRDLAAFADETLTNRQGATAADLDALNETLEIVNGAFATELPVGPQDLVQWGGRDGTLVLKSVRPLSEVPFLTTGR